MHFCFTLLCDMPDLARGLLILIMHSCGSVSDFCRRPFLGLQGYVRCACSQEATQMAGADGAL